MVVKLYPLHIAETKTANGGSEWRLGIEINKKTIKYIPEFGLFTDPGKSPEEILDKLLIKILDYKLSPIVDTIKGIY